MAEERTSAKLHALWDTIPDTPALRAWLGSKLGAAVDEAAEDAACASLSFGDFLTAEQMAQACDDLAALVPAAPACNALFCGPPCATHYPNGPEPAPPLSPDEERLIAADTAAEEHFTKLRTDKTYRAATRKVYRNAFKATGMDAKEAAAKARALTDEDREAMF